MAYNIVSITTTRSTTFTTACYGARTFQTDLSVSVGQLGDLSEPDLDSPLTRAQRLSAEIFGASESFYVTNGTSTSNKAMLMAVLRPGDVVLMDRNCHKSVHQAVVLSGAIPVYLAPSFNEQLRVWAPLELDVLTERLTADYPTDLKPRMLILTTCTYEGIVYPIPELAAACEEQGVLLFADEAWAPYMRFHPMYQTSSGGVWCRVNATDGGAHFAVQSTHKALAAFSQASMIHIGEAFRRALDPQGTQEWEWLRERFAFSGNHYERFRHELLEVLRYWHSTSPHYPMLATLDRAGVQMRIEGTRLIDERLKWVAELSDAVDHDDPLVVTKEGILGADEESRFPGYLKDPLKLLLRYPDAESGRRFQEVLAGEGVQWEKATAGCVQFLITVGTLEAHLKRLRRIILQNRGLLGADEDNLPPSFDRALASGQIAVVPRDAAQDDAVLRPLNEDLIGAICAQMVVPYPPGIPVFLPGLRITERALNRVQETIKEVGLHSVHGLLELDAGGRDYYVKVLSGSAESRLVEQSSHVRSLLEKLD